MASRKKALPDDCMPKCSTCVFMEVEPNKDAGYCRRYPPIIVSGEEGDYSAFPVIEIQDWCGEYQRKVN